MYQAHSAEPCSVLEQYFSPPQYLELGLDNPFPGGSDGKESACNAGDLGLIHWRREWLPTPGFLPGELHGQRNWAGYSPWVTS